MALSATRHLGFNIDLMQKLVRITDKHRTKITGFFTLFLARVRENARIPVKNIQKMLGLQIWISTVFRVARQFLTSLCDILRKTSGHSYFYPRKHPALVARVIHDLKFWRRFVQSPTAADFDYLLNRLPANKERLSCDASSSFGMAGVIHFHGVRKGFEGLSGLFWQIS